MTSVWPLSGKVDIRRGRRRGQIGWAELPQANARRKCRNSANHAPATTQKAGPTGVGFLVWKCTRIESSSSAGSVVGVIPRTWVLQRGQGGSGLTAGLRLAYGRLHVIDVRRPDRRRTRRLRIRVRRKRPAPVPAQIDWSLTSCNPKKVSGLYSN